MPSIWKGAISFGLVTIPVKLYAATSSKTVSFKHLHEECKSPINYRKYCPVCNEEVTKDEIVRGYEYAKGQYVILTDEDLDELPLKSLHNIEILNFIDSKDIDPIYFIKTYYLAPMELGLKAYRLLQKVMVETGKVAIAKIVLRSRENLALLRPYQQSLLLVTMYYNDEVRSPNEITDEWIPKDEPSKVELTMAKQLVESLVDKFEPENYSNRYHEALQELISTRINNKEVVTPEEPKPDDKVVDLMAALRASVAAAEGNKNKKQKRKRRKKAGTGS
ncbi:MAG: end-binding protein Ku [Clostridia bacterium]|nr:end-binding protein Ku [Clostridia bacterium]